MISNEDKKNSFYSINNCTKKLILHKLSICERVKKFRMRAKNR